MDQINQSSRSLEGEPSGHTTQAALLGAVADPLRLRILSLIRSPRPVQEICEALGDVAQPRVSHHLAVLRQQGLVNAERRGRQRFYGWAEPGPGPCRDLLQMLSRWLSREAGPPPSHAASAAVPRPKERPATAELEDFLL